MKLLRRCAPSLAHVFAYLTLIALAIRPCRPGDGGSGSGSRSSAPFASSPFSSSLSIPFSAASEPTAEPVFRAPFYLKTHKTGSSTIAHHLLSYTRRHRLVTLSAPAHIFVATPNPFPDRRCDAIVAHHVAFNLSMIATYMKRAPDLLVTSIRLPLQRQISWFRQQNRDLGNVSCDARDDALLAKLDAWLPQKRSASQMAILTEASRRAEIGADADLIVAQFHFVFVKERLRESFECFCQKTGLRLCSQKNPLAQKNIHGKSCVEQQLIRHRASELLRGSERDLLLYETALGGLGCRVSDECRCPVQQVA